MHRKLSFIIGIAVVLILPLSFFLITKSFQKDKRLIPKYYGLERIDTIVENGKTTYDSIFRKTNELTLINQLGDTVSLNKDLAGKVLIVDFIFTTCKSICPQLTANMRVMQKSFLKKIPDKFQFISISVDPENDSVSVLRQFADAYNVDHDRWWFLTGNKHAIFKFMQDDLGLLLNVDDAHSIEHSSKIVLIDDYRHLRGYYDGLDPVSLKQCADDAIFITLEKNKKK